MARHRTLKCKLAILCFFVSFLFSLIFIEIISYNQKKALLLEQTRNVSQELTAICDKLNQDISSSKKILYYLSSDSDVKQLLSSSQPIGFSSIRLNKTLKNMLQISSIASYVNKLMLTSTKQSIVTVGQMNGAPEDFYRLCHFNKLNAPSDSAAFGYFGITEDPLCSYLHSVSSIPIIRVLHDTQQNPSGFLYLSLNLSIIFDKLREFSAIDYEHLYIKIQNFYYQTDGISFFPCQLPEGIDSSCFSHAGTRQCTITPGHAAYPAVISTLSTEDWSLIQLVVPQNTSFRLLSPSYLLIFLTAVLLFLILRFLLQRWISRPVQNINCQLSSVAQNISVPSGLENSCMEFYEISLQIERMRQELQRSLEKQLQTERTKKDLEFKVLQYQINPHFISNSLNTIKCMGDMQHSYGISTMAQALSNLFRSILRYDTTFVSLRQELNTLHDYITIERYRYKDIFSYVEKIKDPALYDTAVLKFTFQPILENAIFHGIVSKGTFGKIILSVRQIQNDIQVQIYDNGKGMTKEQIQTLLYTAQPEKQAMNQVGVRNIHQRLQLEYGPDYGISIKSVPEKYTLVTIKYPNRKKDV